MARAACSPRRLCRAVLAALGTGDLGGGVRAFAPLLARHERDLIPAPATTP